MRNKLELEQKEDELYDDMGDDNDPIIRAKLDAIEFLLGKADPITELELEPPKNDTDLDKLIATLKAERNNVPEYSFFGDPNWEATDAQIRICEWAKGE